MAENHSQIEESRTTRTQRAVLGDAIAQLEAAEVDHARRNAEWMLAEVLACSRAELYAYPARPVAPDLLRQFEQMVTRRARHEPLQYVLGHEEFYGLRLCVSPGVLIPRPETEEVVEHALRCIEALEAPRVLDVGTGSGCIALAVQHERPDAEVYACDVSSDALTVARSNADALKLNVQFFRADVLRDALADRVSPPVDLIVSNPPYIPDREAHALAPSVRDYEPAVALFAGDDPLRFYRAIAGQAQALLVDGGRLVLETHADHAEDVGVLLERTGFQFVRIQKDLSGRARIAVAQHRVSR